MELKKIKDQLEKKVLYKLCFVKETDDEHIDLTCKLDHMILLEKKIKKEDHKLSVIKTNLFTISDNIITTKKYVIMHDEKKLTNATNAKTIIRNYHIEKNSIDIQFIYDYNIPDECNTFIVILFEYKNFDGLLKFLTKFGL